MRMTLAQAMEHAATQVYCLRRRFSPNEAAFDRAVEFHKARGLVVDLVTGGTRNKHGFVSQFVGYDWAAVYEDMPHAVFYDFFQGVVCNTASRIIRGLEP